MKILLVTIITFSTFASFSQHTTIDSLIAEIGKAEDDQKKVNLYHDLLFQFSITPPQDPENYILPAIRLAEKTGTNVVDVKLQAGRVYWKLGQWDTALKFHFEALKQVDEKKDPKKFAMACTYIGQDYADGGNYTEALKYFEKVKELHQKTNDETNLASIYLMISWVHQHQGNYIESSKSNINALRAFERIKDTYGAAIASGNLAGDYLMLDKNKEAVSYLKKGIPELEKERDYVNLSGNHLTLAKAYIKLNNNDEALKHIQTAYNYGSKISDKIQMGDARSLQADIYFGRSSYSEAATFYLQAIEYYQEVYAGYLLAEQYSKLGICYVRLNKPEQAKASLDSAAYYGKSLESRELLSDHLNGLHLYDSLKSNWKGAYFNFYNYVNIRDSIYNADNTKKLMQNQVQYEFDKKEAEARAEQEKKDILQRTIRNSIAATLAGTLIFLVVVYRQRNKISKARKRSDELLLNILPEEVAEELKAKGSADAKHFDEVTVMFTDFKGFTQISEKLTPSELVAEIDTCFKAFDNIIEAHNIEKIKTIGDAYMCAGGLPVSNQSHAVDVVKAAVAIQNFMHQHLEQRKNEGKDIFEIRIGIHTGPVVAGIVGIKKFAYDIWGDTVNIASRMESSGEPGKVNISGRTYELVKDQFACTHRGKIQAKNKGEIDMYFVDNLLA